MTGPHVVRGRRASSGTPRPPRSAFLIPLLCAFGASRAALAQDAAAPHPAGVPAPDADALLRVPRSMVREGDERPLEQLRLAFLTEVLDREVEALDAEETRLADRPMDDPERLRVATDRGLISTWTREATKTARPVDLAAARDLSPVDRYLLGFAVEKMRTESFDVAVLERWHEQNARYLHSGDPADRQAARMLRNAALARAQDAIVLRRIINEVRTGSLEPDVRDGFFKELHARYPDAPLPPTVAAPAAALQGLLPTLDKAASSGAGPRVDGVERGGAVVPKLPVALPPLQTPAKTDSGKG